MFIGHFGVGLAAKKADTRVSMGTYFIAARQNVPAKVTWNQVARARGRHAPGLECGR